MADIVSREVRSRIMSGIRSKNTQPELTVRRLVFSMGFRYRLHGAALPGKPDLVFAKRKKVIFVHGCFWHRHRCSNSVVPKSRTKFWLAKLEGNKERDRLNLRRLRSLGWRSLVIWECQLQSIDGVAKRIEMFLTG